MRKNKSITFQTVAALLGCLLSFSLTGCFENNGLSAFSQSASLGALSASGDSFTISNVTIVASSSSSTTSSSTPTSLLTTVLFNPTLSTTSISNHCTMNTTKPCLCNFSWQQAPAAGSAALPIQRAVQSPLISVAPNVVTCNSPQVYSTQILDGTVISVSVVPTTGNPDVFQMSPFKFTKSSASGGSSFTDNQGNSFQNILRYSCYEEYTRGMSIGSQMTTIHNPDGSTILYPMANQFCVQKSTDSSGTVGANCTGQVGSGGYTAQAYYYNLFIRQGEKGDINSNDRYKCPTVIESLGNDGSVGTQGQHWPLDSSFALSLSPSTTFTVGVEAFTKTSNGTDPVTANSTCGTVGTSASPTPAPAGGSSGSTTSLIQSCLGFAMPVNSDGTCPSFKDSSNQIRFTYRLRRYVSMYPPIFDTDGQPLAQGQATDTVYVVDRPVTSPDPLKPYTMKGPKPCPFSFFDKSGVTHANTDTDDSYLNARPVYTSMGSHHYRPQYAASNNAGWTGTNVDGIAFPNVDTARSCSAMVPVLGSNKSVLSLATVNNANPALQQLYIRPIQAWAPHYEEDTDFQACAPLASPFIDPPLHFSRDTSTGNISWCAEAYPSQNPNVTALDFQPLQTGPYIGRVQNYTSHVVKNAPASATCSATPAIISSSHYPSATSAACPAYPATNAAGISGGVARHPTDWIVDVKSVGGVKSNVCSPVTCDRTVIATGLDWTAFPLLAPPADVENAMNGDPAYNCTITYDNNGAKQGKATPSGGCCGPIVSMPSGLTGNPSAHLEPNALCVTPTY